MTDLTAELVVDGRSPRTPALSPDGRLVTYVLDGDVWLAGSDGTPAPHRIASGVLPRWSAGSDAVFFLSGGQLHRATVAGGTVAALTDRPGGFTGHLPLAAPGPIALLALTSRAGDILVAGRDEPRARLHLLDPDTGRLTTPAVFTGRHVAELRQRPGGGPLAVLTRAGADDDLGPRTNQLHLYDPATGAVQDLGPAGVDARALTWWPAGDGWHLGHLALTGPLLAGGTAVFDLALSSGTLRNRTDGLTMCPTGLQQTGAAPLVVFADGLDTTLARLDPGGPATVARLPGRVDHLTTDTSGSRIAALTGTRYAAPDVYAGRVSGPLRRLTDTRPELAGVTFGVQQPLRYRAADGLDLDALLVLPAGRAATDGPFPLVTIAHGGPYDRYADRLQLFPAIPSAQWLAAAGYAVLLPNPRGSLGRGHAFAASVAGRVGQEEWGDIMTGIDLLVARGVADPGRLGIAGWSHGGFLAAWAVGQTPRFRAAIVGAGISDWGMLAATGHHGQFEAALGGSTGWEGPGPHPHDTVSPISYASRIRTPVLILHGAQDTNVPLGQAVYLHRALRHFGGATPATSPSGPGSPRAGSSGPGSPGVLPPGVTTPGVLSPGVLPPGVTTPGVLSPGVLSPGVEHEFVVYPREGHVIRERDHQLDLLHRTRAWFDRWLTAEHQQP